MISNKSRRFRREFVNDWSAWRQRVLFLETTSHFSFAWDSRFTQQDYITIRDFSYVHV